MKKRVILVIGRNDTISKCLKKHIHLRNYDDINFSKNIIWKFYGDSSIDFLDYEGLLDILDENNLNNLTIINIDKFEEKIDCDSNELLMFEKNNKFNLSLLNACVELKITNYINIVPKEVKDLSIKPKKTIDNYTNISNGLLYSKLITCMYTSILNNFSQKFNYTNIYTSKLIGEYIYLTERNTVYEILIILDKSDKNMVVTLPYNPDHKLNIITSDFLVETLIEFVTIDNLEDEYELSLDEDMLISISTIVDIISEYINTKYDKNLVINFKPENSDNLIIKNDNQRIKDVFTKYNLLTFENINLKEEIFKMIEFYYTNKEYINQSN